MVMTQTRKRCQMLKKLKIMYKIVRNNNKVSPPRSSINSKLGGVYLLNNQLDMNDIKSLFKKFDECLDHKELRFSTALKPSLLVVVWRKGKKECINAKIMEYGSFYIELKDPADSVKPLGLVSNNVAEMAIHVYLLNNQLDRNDIKSLFRKSDDRLDHKEL
ncbi:hypothetical protein E2562_014904, partial [Oryza meyeriana var. granulata]